MAEELSIAFVAGQLSGIKDLIAEVGKNVEQRLADQSQQRETDKEEAIRDRERRHAESKAIALADRAASQARFEAVETRVSNLETARMNSRSEAKGAAKVWGFIGSAGTGIAGVAGYLGWDSIKAFFERVHH